MREKPSVSLRVSVQRSCDGDCKPLLRALAAAFCLNVAQRTEGQKYRRYIL